jgi:eukaryotic-like serine/threonine-protein kinase
MSVPPAQGQAKLADRYRVLHRLGSGGMASVVLAEDELLGRLVAVKRLPTESPDEALSRFRREARLGASLNHPNIVSIYDSIADEDSVLIVMEYVEGESLGDLLAEGPVEPGRAIEILRQVADALDHAHANGVIHRDVKPANVLLRSDGLVKLADLGIATAVGATAITSTESVVGTLAYMAPERLDGKTEHKAADIYSLAAVAYEALSGRRAQQAETPAELVSRTTKGPPPDLRRDWHDAPLEVAAVLRDGLSEDPERRPRSARGLIDRLDTALRLAGSEKEPEPMLPPTRPLSEAAAGPVGPVEHAMRRPRSFALLALAGATIVLVIAIASALGGGDDGTKPVAAGGAPKQGKAKQDDASSKPAPAPAPSGGDEEAGGNNESDGGIAAPAASGAALNDQGYALMQQGRYAEAIPILQRAVESFPEGTSDLNYAYALFNLGSALRLAGRPQEAIPILEQRLQIPNQTEAVQHELELARVEAGLAPAEPGKEHKPPGQEKKKEKD